MKSSKKRVTKVSEESDSDVSESEGDMAKHEKELLKEINKKVVNWKAVLQLQKLTFPMRSEAISNIMGRSAVSGMLQRFPYLEHEKVVINNKQLL